MTIEQTVEITENGWFHLNLPPEFPVGASARIVVTVPADADTPRRPTSQEIRDAIEKCSGLTKGSGLTSDVFLEMRRKDRELEEAQHRKLFHIDEEI
jgi:hypothetical protein